MSEVVTTSTPTATSASPEPAPQSTATPEISAPVRDDSDHYSDSDSSLDSAILSRWENDGLVSDDGQVDFDGQVAPRRKEAATEDETVGEATTTEPIVEPPVEQEDSLAAELGLDPKKVDKYRKIPYHKVERIIENKKAQAIEDLTGIKRPQGMSAAEFISQQKSTFADGVTRLQQYEQHFQQTDQKLSEVAAVEQLMEQEPIRFLQTIAAHPAYAQILAPIFGGSTARTPNPAAAAPAVPSDMPQPDFDLGNGNYTYSEEGFQRRLAWERAEAVREAEARISKQFAPLLQKHEVEQRIERATTTARAQYEKLQSRPLFLQSVDEITTLLKKDPNISADDAYWAVVGPKLTADHNSVRSAVVQELQKAPKSTSTSSKLVPRPAETSSDDELNARIAANWKKDGLL